MPYEPDEPTRMAMHLCYEVTAMGEMAAIVGTSDATPTVVANACLEASLVHVRLLIEFLTGRPGSSKRFQNKAADITPQDFIELWGLDGRKDFDGWLDLADKHVVHLSKERSKPMVPMDINNFRQIVTSVLKEFERFVLACEQEKSPHAHVFRGALTTSRDQLQQAMASGDVALEE